MAPFLDPTKAIAIHSRPAIARESAAGRRASAWSIASLTHGSGATRCAKTHSQRRAKTGSTRAARSAGMYEAASATIAKMVAPPT